MFHIIALVSLLGFMNKATAFDASRNGTEGKVILYLCKDTFVINKVCCVYIWLTIMANGLEKKTISSVPLSNFILSGILNFNRHFQGPRGLIRFCFFCQFCQVYGSIQVRPEYITREKLDKRRCSAHSSNPLPFYNPILTETIRLLYSFCWQIALFS